MNQKNKLQKLIITTALIFGVGIVSIINNASNSSISVKAEECPEGEHVEPIRGVRENVIPATCESAGSYDNVFYCTKCGKELRRSKGIISATGHNWGATVITKNATCSEPGEGFQTCQNEGCGATQTISIPALEHKWSPWSTVPATCTEDGYRTRECSVCHEIEREDIPASGSHLWSPWSTVPATCTEDGYRTRECSVCHKIEREDLPATGNHSWGDWVTTKSATCVEDGSRERECSVCHKVETETIPAAGNHSWGDWVTVPATCIDDGLKTRECSICHEIEREVIPARGVHTYGDWTITDSTCTKDGYKTRECTTCHHIDTEIIPMKGHSYDEGKIIKEATCSEEGIIRYTCSRDGDIKDEPIAINPNNHVHTKLIGNKIATRDAEGYTGDLVCLDCTDKSGNPTVLEKGHSIDKIVVTDDNKEEVAEQAKETISSLVSGDGEVKEEVSEALEKASQDTLIEVGESVSNTFNELSELVSSGEITQEKYEEYIEVLTTVTENVVVVGSKMDNVEEENEDIIAQIPEESTVDLGGSIQSFYENCYKDLLGKPRNNFNPAEKAPRFAQGASEGGIDYENTSLETYQQVELFCDTSVNNMAEAGLLVRQCSGEKVQKQINLYIEEIAVSSFRDFDKEAADEEFYENAYQATLLEMQQQTLAQLQEQYDSEAKNAVGTAKNKLTEDYEAQKADVEDVETFEWMVIEVMRQKYMTIMNDRLASGILTQDEYDAQIYSEEQLEEFKVVYKAIFKSWALGTDSGYDISLETLSQTVIGNFTRQVSSTPANIKVSAGDVALIVGVIAAVALAVGGLIIVKRVSGKKED